MKIYLVKPDQPTLGLGVIYASIALAIIAGVWLYQWTIQFFQAEHLPILKCVFKKITHIPCPTCDATRSIHYLGHLKFLESLKMNPIIFLVTVLLINWGIITLAGRVFNHRRLKIEFGNSERKILVLFIVLTILINWFYLIFIARV
ncbi:MAG: DUF2752 domain-containing protein [Planctomycetes bacterium]|nr:DUF2752 domain-containing protein [Planctomycetota bacterium]